MFFEKTLPSGTGSLLCRCRFPETGRRCPQTVQKWACSLYGYSKRQRHIENIERCTSFWFCWKADGLIIYDTSFMTHNSTRLVGSAALQSFWGVTIDARCKHWHIQIGDLILNVFQVMAVQLFLNEHIVLIHKCSLIKKWNFNSIWFNVIFSGASSLKTNQIFLRCRNRASI